MKKPYQTPTLKRADALVRIAAETTITATPIPSDRRLKTDVVEVGLLRQGIPLYRFRYIGGTEVFVGVMAQDVLPVAPKAVILDEHGFMRVDYAKLGARMIRWEEWLALEPGAQAGDEAPASVSLLV